MLCLQEAVCAALEEYSEHIEALKEDIEAATTATEAIRRDIAALSQRSVAVGPEDLCGVSACLNSMV